VAGVRLHQRYILAYVDHNLKITLYIAIAALRKCKERITSIEQAMSLNGVGEKTALKVAAFYVFPFAHVS